MKKLFSFFTLLLFIIIAFFQNPMISFAVQEMGDMEMSMSDNMQRDCCFENSNTKQDCNHECCYES